jgi:hypothetical protein
VPPIGIACWTPLDEDELQRCLQEVSSWEGWELLEEELFHLSDWPERPDDLAEADLARPPVTRGENIWYPLGMPYAVAPELFTQHERARAQVFLRLCPEAARENARHPEWFGAACFRCLRYRRQAGEGSCPTCGEALLSIPLNEETTHD